MQLTGEPPVSTDLLSIAPEDVTGLGYLAVVVIPTLGPWLLREDLSELEKLIGNFEWLPQTPARISCPWGMAGCVSPLMTYKMLAL